MFRIKKLFIILIMLSIPLRIDATDIGIHNNKIDFFEDSDISICNSNVSLLSINDKAIEIAHKQKVEIFNGVPLYYTGEMCKGESVFYYKGFKMEGDIRDYLFRKNGTPIYKPRHKNNLVSKKHKNLRALPWGVKFRYKSWQDPETRVIHTIFYLDGPSKTCIFSVLPDGSLMAPCKAR